MQFKIFKERVRLLVWGERTSPLESTKVAESEALVAMVVTVVILKLGMGKIEITL